MLTARSAKIILDKFHPKFYAGIEDLLVNIQKLLLEWTKDTLRGIQTQFFDIKLGHKFVHARGIDEVGTGKSGILCSHNIYSLVEILCVSGDIAP